MTDEAKKYLSDILRAITLIEEFLSDKPVKIDFYEVLPDDKVIIAERLRQLADKEKVKLIFTFSLSTRLQSLSAIRSLSSGSTS